MSSAKPKFDFSSFFDSTKIGVEIEIGIKQKHYYSIPSKEENSRKRFFDFKKKPNPFSDTELNKIILYVDETCNCKIPMYEADESTVDSDPYYPAEIISPKMKKNEIPEFFKFLQENIFNDMTNINQGQTCGIHIHYSNEEFFMENPYYIFEFIKIIYHLRKYMSKFIRDSEFSGKIHSYSDFVNNRDITFIDSLKLFVMELIPLNNDDLDTIIESSLKIASLKAKQIKFGVEEYKKKCIKSIFQNLKNNSPEIRYYDLQNFHMEFRMWSLDKLFESKTNTVTADDIIQELSKFIIFTNNFMVSVLTRLRDAFDIDKNKIDPSKKSEYEDFFFLTKEPTLEQIKKRIAELFKIPIEETKNNRLETPVESLRENNVSPPGNNRNEIKDTVTRVTTTAGLQRKKKTKRKTQKKQKGKHKKNKKKHKGKTKKTQRKKNKKYFSNERYLSSFNHSTN